MKNRELDQFYTNTDISFKCFKLLKEHINLDDYSVFLEPSAGNGSFYNLLPLDKRIGLDIDPKISGIEKINFFDYIPDFLDKRVLTLGNPPFGKNSNLAVKFFNKSAEFSDCIAFVLPKTFRKASIHNRLNEYFHLIFDEETPKNSFVFQGNAYDVPCCFQIWIKKSEKRDKKIIVKSHSDFKLVGKMENPDFAIQRVGGNAGLYKPKEIMMNYSDQSHYFIKALKDLELVVKVFCNIDFKSVKYNTAGNPSISSSELYQLYEIYKDLLNE